jgi:homoserine dehydrogenase
MNIAIIGFGNVGRGFVNLLVARQETLAVEYGFAPKVIAILAKRGVALDPKGIDLNRDIAISPPPIQADAAIADADVVVELTPTDVQTGGPGLHHCRMALSMGKHVVTANKGPLVVAYRELAALAKKKGVQFRFEGTVMGGTPSIVLGLETLAAAGVRSMRGIVNGTTNFILTRMEAGASYTDALKAAQQMGYAEADPAGDVDGWDAAAKAAILANTLMGGDLRINDVDREGITGITAEMIAEAKAEGQRWKLIAHVKRDGDRLTASVRPTRVPLTDPLALVGGGMNALTYETEAIGNVTLMGAGAGGTATGFAVLSDLLKIHQRM